MIKPLTPNEVDDNPDVPEYVIEAVNNLLRQQFRKGSCTFKQKEVVNEIIKLAPEGVTKDELFDKGYMDFEIVFENAGWKVSYDKPAYNETYEPTFTFERKDIKS